MSNQVYNNFKKLLLSGAVNLSTATVKVLLTTSSYTFSQNHTVTGNITSEITSSNYTAGGKKVDNTAIYIDSVNNKAFLSGSSVTYTGISASPAYGIIYISGGTAATNYLLGQLDLGSQTVSSADFAINWTSGSIYSF